MAQLELPRAMKEKNMEFFNNAQSGDPTVAIPGCKNLVDNLSASMAFLGITEYDESLKKCRVWVNRAYFYYFREHAHYESYIYVNAITQELSTIIYMKDMPFSSNISNTQKYSQAVKPNV